MQLAVAGCDVSHGRAVFPHLAGVYHPHALHRGGEYQPPLGYLRIKGHIGVDAVVEPSVVPVVKPHILLAHRLVVYHCAHGVEHGLAVGVERTKPRSGDIDTGAQSVDALRGEGQFYALLHQSAAVARLLIAVEHLPLCVGQRVIVAACLHLAHIVSPVGIGTIDGGISEPVVHRLPEIVYRQRIVVPVEVYSHLPLVVAGGRKVVVGGVLDVGVYHKTAVLCR